MRWVILVLSLLSPAPVAAQEAETVYMGIDLTGQQAPQQRTLGLEMRELLDEGVTLGCLAFTPPDSFAQTDNRSEQCQAYIARLTAATAPQAAAGGSGEPLGEAQANTMRSVPLHTLARAAQAGSKRAQLELGIRFEEGIGVEQNWDNALELYTQAGRATPARSVVAVNAATDQSVFAGDGGGTIGRRQTSRRIPGLSEARDRRDALEARMAGQD